ncbi:Taurine catabolism dioxygenase TauD/TfdA [Parvibaculum lavamentivorans DS-1]|uniref:Taurine catabolism dioxygenase TauD/TfdA n=1 Tax=Parvibaculum lavamentivorans (strain DS-1 / DSM 13023 / NCIMB 13966) TaxID=402881 RepID=A7HQL7_PARL1|nr:TauD/TfdA family dioxygenase [Parvibaculum lavamentivorans]ABS62200.1 Taurine catabolism dioxygenase TauD/TfdA [Parvibaculum lavamentivorans DS-1]
MTPRILETASDWRASDIADEEGWTLRLSAADVAEIDAALAHAKAKGSDLLDVTKVDFPLPLLAGKLARLEDDLINGRGFCRIAGLPVERYSDDDASLIYWGIGMHLGKPWPQNKHGHLLGDVTDQGKSGADPTSRGNEIGGVAFPYHSDGSDLVGLMCLRKAKSGGISTVANAVAIHNELVRTRPDLAALLYEPQPYDYRGEQPEGGQPFYFVPVFTEHGGRLFVRYIRPYIESSQRHADAPRLSAKAREAFDLVDAMCADPAFNVYMDLEPGDMQFVNNYHVLHARTAYEDWPERNRKRHLKRLWLETAQLTDRPERFRNFSSHWSKNRTKSELKMDA